MAQTTQCWKGSQSFPFHFIFVLYIYRFNEKSESIIVIFQFKLNFSMRYPAGKSDQTFVGNALINLLMTLLKPFSAPH